ncbi:hypothetical protein LR48_Vigan04g118000 [Vigna angularis]|uniref:Uncharacterized protein n=1 Tax=Phaseolus angularis TaxID=3914 RepID=A0A0L9UEM4_PHAAN|nr:hypothetical protein LR48_Vigan04g118000 [Vigna angularis]
MNSATSSYKPGAANKNRAEGWGGEVQRSSAKSRGARGSDDLVYGKDETLGLEDSEGKKGLGFGKQCAIMDFIAEKKESENNNANNPENALQTLYSSSQLASTLDSSNKETKEQQSHELKAGLHPLKVFLPHFNFLFLGN